VGEPSARAQRWDEEVRETEEVGRKDSDAAGTCDGHGMVSRSDGCQQQLLPQHSGRYVFKVVKDLMGEESVMMRAGDGSSKRLTRLWN
jgi:hypothetical protein